MTRELWTAATLSVTLIVCDQVQSEPRDSKRQQRSAVEAAAPLRTFIDARLAEIEAARAARPQLFETVDRNIPLFAKPVRVPSARVIGAIEYLQEPLEPALLDRETRRIVERFPEAFQQVRAAARQWLADAETSLQPIEWSEAVKSTYRNRLQELQVECSCPPSDFWRLVDAAGPHNLRGLPYLDPEYLIAWEAVLVQEDVSWQVKERLLPIVFRVREPKSSGTLVMVRRLALDCENARNGNGTSDCVHASAVARQVVTFLLSQPTRAALVELGEIVKQEEDERASPKGAVPPDTTRIGLELSQSKEWKALLDTAEAEKGMAEYVARLREAMRLASDQKTKGRD